MAVLTYVIVVAVLLLHIGLAVWAGAGLFEWLFGSGPWPRLTNPDLPRAILFLHWTVSLATAVAFLAGFALRWPLTPLICAFGYVSMATICAVETTNFLTSPSRHAAMGVEYAVYLTVGILLFNLEAFRQLFQLDAI